MPATQIATLWQITGYRRLLAARFISNLGNGMAPTAVAFGILALKGATPSSLSMVLVAQAIPLVIFLPIGGVLADRFRRAVVVSSTDIILSVVVFGIAALFQFGHARILYLVILNAMAGILNALWWPAFPGLTPSVVSQDQLQSANAYMQAVSNLGIIVGSAMGGILVASFGSGPAMAFDAFTFLVAGLLVWKLRSYSEVKTESASMIHELRSGLREFLSRRWVVVIVGAFSVIVMMQRGAEGVLGPVLMKEHFDGPKSWALVATFESVGFLVGSLIGSKYRPKYPMLFCMIITLTASVYLLLMAVPAPLLVIGLGAFVWGATVDLWGVYWMTALQTHIPRESLSRVVSYDAMGSLMFGPIGLALAGPAIVVVGLRNAFMIGAAVIAVCVGAALLEPQVRRLTSATTNA
ncbi:putative bacilysin exporter BacE [mine drainage metagenome]|uniref:Putative bacilysin exporter BacE n=1 Tax=mine drainage metagenome TaxID=410659 RepID=A0A1J5Q0Z3_9ZZZZ